MQAIELEKVSKFYMSGNIRTDALTPISLTVKKGKFVSIMGSSGSGKSTLLNILGSLDQPSEGYVLINGVDVTSYTSNQLADVRYENIK